MSEIKEEYKSEFSGAEIDGAVRAVLARGASWDGKQDRLTGQPGQVVGFDETGQAVAQAAPSSGGGGTGGGGEGGGVPSGCILLWSGAADAIPEGWALCDGENDTPDLRDRFVLGAGSSYAVGAMGGEATHTLTDSEMPRHYHSVNLKHTGTNNTPSSSIERFTTSNSSTVKYNSTNYASGYAGSGAAHNNMPPYYALCYIMKL